MLFPQILPDGFFFLLRTLDRASAIFTEAELFVLHKTTAAVANRLFQGMPVFCVPATRADDCLFPYLFSAYLADYRCHPLPLFLFRIHNDFFCTENMLISLSNRKRSNSVLFGTQAERFLLRTVWIVLAKYCQDPVADKTLFAMPHSVILL